MCVCVCVCDSVCMSASACENVCVCFTLPANVCDLMCRFGKGWSWRDGVFWEGTACAGYVQHGVKRADVASTAWFHGLCRVNVASAMTMEGVGVDSEALKVICCFDCVIVIVFFLCVFFLLFSRPFIFSCWISLFAPPPLPLPSPSSFIVLLGPCRLLVLFGWLCCGLCVRVVEDSVFCLFGFVIVCALWCARW